MINTASGLQYEEVQQGNGIEAARGHVVKVQYTGKLQDGTEFDSSRGREAFSFRIGDGMVIAGWEEGLQGMKVGGKRSLIIPSNLGYGDEGYPGLIPPRATLYFDVELVSVE